MTGWTSTPTFANTCGTLFTSFNGAFLGSSSLADSPKLSTGGAESFTLQTTNSCLLVGVKEARIAILLSVQTCTTGAMEDLPRNKFLSFLPISWKAKANLFCTRLRQKNQRRTSSMHMYGAGANQKEKRGLGNYGCIWNSNESNRYCEQWNQGHNPS